MSLTVNGQAISRETIADEMERLRPEHERVFAEMEEAARETQLCAWATENVIERTLLHQHAETSDIKVKDEDVDQAVTQLQEAYEDEASLYAALGKTDAEQVRHYVETSLRAEQLLQGVRDTVAAPVGAQIEEHYQQHREQYQVPERVHAAHIVVHVDWQQGEADAQAKLAAAQEELRKGTPFHLVAEKFSDCPEQGGDLGSFARGQMVEEFEDVIFNLGPGQISEVFRSRYGLHIATVYQHEPATISSLQDVRERVTQELHEQLRNDAVYAFIDTLKADAEIVNSTAS